MSDELGALIRAGADAEAARAAHERTFTPERIAGYVRDVRRRRMARTVAMATAAVVVLSAAAVGVARPWAPGPPADVPTVGPTEPTSPSPEPSATPTEPALPNATPAPVGTAPAPTQPPVEVEETPPTEPEPEPEPELPEPPGAVTIVRVGPAGGSGETFVQWDPVPGATGYRVYRSDSPDGPFVAAASYDVATAVSTDEYAGPHEYVGIFTQGSVLEYVEAVAGRLAFLRVVAFNAGGEGPASATVCGEPQAQGYTCPQ